ncbi:MAG: SpoIID/LytB domain-containing protein [Leptolyngbyaceae cyanobacterium bins.349]|nr:SpoIID/LytB domain-containing protein [Leptolyngbyaceae cyanobacterium bins.349]
MNWQLVTNWLKQRPWLMVPVMGLIPLIGIPLINRASSLSLGVSPAPSPSASVNVVKLPTIAPSPSPNPAPSPQPSPSVRVVKPQGVTAAKATTPSPTNMQAVQPAINLSVDAAIQMRVLIQKSASALQVGASDGAGIFDLQSNKLLHELPANSRYEMQADGNGIWLGSVKLPALVWIDPSPTGVTFIGDRGYRGRILIASNGSGMWVVNYVNLQQYLYSVVGSEVSPSWPMEALKAQAVAARSYALTYHLKPVKQDLYDLGDDEYFQVYKGIETEAQTTKQAVNSTSGEFVSYRGGVVESLYAATDDIVMDAFQGHGMSQIGALGLAEQGHSYRQILGTYYAGTGIGRIEMDIE